MTRIVECCVERDADDPHDLVNLSLGDDERRRHGEQVDALAKRLKAYTLTNWIHKSNSTCQETQLMHAVTPEMNAAFLSKIPMGRFCKPEEVAAIIAFLLGDDLSFTSRSVFDLIRNSPDRFSLPTIATQRIRVRFKRFQWFAASFPSHSLSLTPKPLVAPSPR
jgi:hypothetical protein